MNLIPWTNKRCFRMFLLVSPLAFFSCVSLNAVREFSSTSMVSIQNFEKLGYTFSDHCLDRCEDEAIAKFEFKRTLECSCQLYTEADSVTQVIYQTINGYFEGLGNLAQNELTAYSTDSVASSLTAAEWGPLKIDENVAGAYATVSNVLLRATTDLYRKRKIAAYLSEANAPIQILLERFQGIIRTNIKGELRFKKERMYAYYMDMKLKNTLHSDYERGQATSDYYQALREIQRTEKQLDLFAECLAEIAKGHQTLYDNRNKLTVKNLTVSMLEYSGQVKLLMSEFNQLNR